MRMALTCIKTMGIALCAATIALANAPARAQPATDADVLAARDAALRGQWKVLEAYRGRLAGELREPYQAYWLLAGNLERSDPREVQAFLARYPSSPLAESLRREWLKALGAEGSWELFRAEYSRVQGDDVEITCYSFQERLARADPEVVAEAMSLFLSWRETAAACDPAFAVLTATRGLTEAEAWERARRMLSLGNVKEAKRVNAFLPARLGLQEKPLDKANSDPAAFLAREKLQPLTRATLETVVFALARLARNKPEDAADRLAALAPRLGDDAARYAWGQVAWQAAMNHHPRALEWYANAKDGALTDSQIAWRARAALRAGDWKEVIAAIQALPPEEARDPAWRYWRARPLRALGSTQAAAALFKGIAGSQSYYAVLAAEEVGIAVTPPWNGWPPPHADAHRRPPPQA